MKKFLAILCMLAMLLTLAACGEKPDDDGSAGGDNTRYTADGKIAVDFWSTWSGSTGEKVQQMADDFNASQDKYFVTVNYNGGYGDTWTKFLAMPKTDWPDIVYINAEKMPDFMYEPGLAKPMQDFIDAEGYDTSNIQDSLIGQYSDGNGDLLMMPMGNTMVGFFYNKTLCDQAGVDPAELKHFPDFVEACRKVNKATGCPTPLAMGRNPIYYTFLYTAEGIKGLNNNNGRDEFPTESMLGADPLKKATTEYLTAIADLAKDGLMAPFSGSTQDFIDMFSTGKTCFMFFTCSSATAIYNTMNGAYEFGFLPAPSASADGVVNSTPAGGGGLFIPDNSRTENQQGAWEFTKFLMEDAQTSLFARQTGYLPVTKSTVNDPEYQKYMTEVFKTAQLCMDAQAVSDPATSFTPAWPAGMDYATPIYTAIDTVMADPSVSIDSVVATLQQSLQDALDLVVMVRG